MAQYGSSRRLFGYVSGHGVLLERFLSAELPPVLGYALTQTAYDQITPVQGTYYVIYSTAQATPIYEVMHCTQAEYDQLTPWANGLYIIEESGEILDVLCGTVAADKLYQGAVQIWANAIQSAALTDEWRDVTWSIPYDLVESDITGMGTQAVIIRGSWNDDYGGKQRYIAEILPSGITSITFTHDSTNSRWTSPTFSANKKEDTVRWNSSRSEWQLSSSSTSTNSFYIPDEVFENLILNGLIYTTVTLIFGDKTILPTAFIP